MALSLQVLSNVDREMGEIGGIVRNWGNALAYLIGCGC